jgi:hypothetical protein
MARATLEERVAVLAEKFHVGKIARQSPLRPLGEMAGRGAGSARGSPWQFDLAAT